MKAARLTVCHSWTQYGGDQAKTPAGQFRKVPLVPGLVAALREHRAAAPHSRDADPVFARPGGGFRTPSYFWRCFNRSKKAAGVREEVVIHSLRHLAASRWAAESGGDAQTVRRVMGDSSIDITHNRYGHLLSGEVDLVAERMARRERERAERGAGEVRAVGA